jgi:glycerate 2-kinase
VSGAREQLLTLYGAAIDGANVQSLTANALATIPLERRQRVWLFAFGKAAHGMAASAVTALHRSLAEISGGLVVAPEAGDYPCGTVAAVEGDHPVPGRRSFAAAMRISEQLTRKRGNDLGIVLVSGGASSLIAAPLRGMSEADLSLLYESLLGCGLDIHEMNAIRKRFSQWGGGRMALGLAPARTYCFAVSDVPNDDLATIGSGPCVPDPTKVHAVMDSLKRVKLFDRLPASFRQYLLDTARGVIPETPKATHPAFAHVTARVIANNTGALKAAATAARNSGCHTVIQEQPLVGDAASAGARVAEALLRSREALQPGTTHCIIWGGETTVTLRGPAPAGGRCQELALAASKHLADAGDRASGITLLAAGTDGRDGPTDAAGAVVDASTWQAIVSGGRDPNAALRAHESYDALAVANALFAPGMTGTNVMDITIGLVRA